MSDFRLSHEEGFVEDEVEVRGEEYTLRGGQESYAVYQHQNGGTTERLNTHAIAIVASHGVSRFEGRS